MRREIYDIKIYQELIKFVDLKKFVHKEKKNE